MAIGDAVADIIGAATTNRQPASGDEEQITSIQKPDTTDAIAVYNGSVTAEIMGADVKTQEDAANPSQRSYVNDFNLAIGINNSVYLRKMGTTDTVGFTGIQTNA